MKNTKSLVVKIGLCCSLLLLAAFIRKDNDPVNRLVAVLQKWTDSIPQEKVYLQMDKPYYALGDTIWFKGYVTIGSRHQLSALSGSMYVDLISDQDSVIRSLKLPITSGMVMGDFTLSDELNEGSYRIRAYTQWMRNAGEDYFYDHTFTVGNVASNNVISKADYSYKTINNKQVLTAILNYTDDQGKPLANRNVRYNVMLNKRAVWSENVKTDAQGNVPITINNDKYIDLNGSYIHTVMGANEKTAVTRDFPIKASLTQTDVQFFPESGSMVNGLNSRVAFKAVGIDGSGANVKGRVIDETGAEVTTFESRHAGMGSFLLHPMTGKTYTAQVTFADGSLKTIALPKANDEGYVLSIYQPNTDSILVRINASATLKQSTVNLIAHTNGEPVFASPIKLNAPVTSIWLQKKSFPTGIAQFTLFNAAGEPLNERIAFIRSNDFMHLNVKTAKTGYDSKERILLNLDAKDSKGKGVAGNFSVSVIDESKVPADENDESTIFSNLLLTSDLKGYVEKPNYYFTKETEEVNKALDNLMLTQGYRRFTWKELNNTVDTKPKFAVEGLGVTISGRVTSLGKKISVGATVNLMSIKAGVMKATTTDERGRFKFDGIFMTDSIRFAVEARSASKSDKVILELDTLPRLRINKNRNMADVSININGSLKAYLENSRKEDDIYEKLGMLDKVHRLAEVRIRAKKASINPDANIKPQGMYRIPEVSADKVIAFSESEAMACTDLAMCLQARLPGVSIYVDNQGYKSLRDMRPSDSALGTGTGEGPQIWLILDGRKITDPGEVDEILSGSIQPEDVAKIEMVRTNRAMISMLGGKAVLIMTKLGTTRKQYNPNVANVSPKGFYKAREFYSPRYDKPGEATRLPDLRTTVYWNPYLKTDAEGKTSFNFFNADGPGTYKVIIEGINADGELGRTVYRYSVNGTRGTTAAIAVMPSADKNLAVITAPLDSFNKKLPTEKVYLHTDKPYYNIGDTLWFKSYVVDRANQPSKISGLLYVELDNDTSEMVRRISIPIKDGVAWGQIPLAKAIFREGGYVLRAYTNWMQNFGEDYVFNQRFYLGQPTAANWLVNSSANINRVANKDQLQVAIKLSKTDKLLSPVAVKKVQVKIYDEYHYIYKQELQTGIDGSLKFNSPLRDSADARRLRVQIISLEKGDNFKEVMIPLRISRKQNIDVQFLPEGGNMVAGVKSTIGFKAIGEDGRGTPVWGAIVDGAGKEIVQFTTLHNGMGSFEFTPYAGVVYTARISQPVAKTFVLPKIDPTGTVMHISNAEESNDLMISLAGMPSLGTDSVLYLVGTSRGIAYYTTIVKPDQTSFTVSKALFPTGVARFTFFKGQRPLNQRAVFVDNHDQLSFKITPDKANYLTRDSVGLDIEVKDKSGIPVQGNFSLAVTDDSQVRADSAYNNGIAANLLLNSELRGHIETPGYYVNRKDKQAWQALDNLLLTQGWTGYLPPNKRNRIPGQPLDKPVLAQGVTGYQWDSLFYKKKPVKIGKEDKEVKERLFRAEKQLVITGRVSNITNKPIPEAMVIMSSQKPQFFANTNTNALGIYEFKNFPTIDSGSFFLQVNNAKGKKISSGEITVDRFKAPRVPANYRDPILPWYVNTDSAQLNYVKRVIAKADDGNLNVVGKLLSEVKIKDKKIIKNTQNPFGPGNADEIFDEKDIKESATTNLYELLKQKAPGLKIMGAKLVTYRGMDMWVPVSSLNGLAVQLMIDGGPVNIDIDDATGIPHDITYEKVFVHPLQGPGKDRLEYVTSAEGSVVDGLRDIKLPGIVGLEIVYSRKYTNRLGPIGGDVAIIQLTTNKGEMGWYRRKPPGVISYRPLPLAYPQQFYSPKYSVPATTTTEPDYRSTLYWEPNVNTDQNGRAKVSFYTSDIKNKYTVKITGNDASGDIGDGGIKINDGRAANAAVPAAPDAEKKSSMLIEPSKKKAQ